MGAPAASCYMSTVGHEAKLCTALHLSALGAAQISSTGGHSCEDIISLLSTAPAPAQAPGPPQELFSFSWPLTSSLQEQEADDEQQPYSFSPRASSPCYYRGPLSTSPAFYVQDDVSPYDKSKQTEEGTDPVDLQCMPLEESVLAHRDEAILHKRRLVWDPQASRKERRCEGESVSQDPPVVLLERSANLEAGSSKAVNDCSKSKLGDEALKQMVVNSADCTALCLLTDVDAAVAAQPFAPEPTAMLPVPREVPCPSSEITVVLPRSSNSAFSRVTRGDKCSSSPHSPESLEQEAEVCMTPTQSSAVPSFLPTCPGAPKKKRQLQQRDCRNHTQTLRNIMRPLF